MSKISRVMVELQSPEQSLVISENLRYPKVQIESISIPHIWYYVSKDSVVTFVDSLGATHTFTITKGSPTIDQLLVTIVGQLNSLETGAATYNYVVNNQQLTWQITSTANWAISFGSILAQHLGLTVATPYGGWGLPPNISNTLTSGRFFMSNQQVVINTNIGSIGQSISFDNLTAEKGTVKAQITPSSYLVSWPIVSSYGEVETYYLGDFGLIFELTSGGQQLNFRITDEFGNLLDFTPQRAYINLAYTC